MNETLTVIHSLKSIHTDFSDREISDADLRTILNACVQAATASARQTYSIVIVDDRQVMKQLGYVGSKSLVFCLDYNRLVDIAAYMSYDYCPEGIFDFVTGAFETALAAQTAAIAARSLGIDCQFTNNIHRENIKRVYELLQLPPKSCFPLIALVLGYPKIEPDRRKGRLNGAGLIHFGKYRKLTDPEKEALIKQHDNPENKLGIEINWKAEGFEHYLDWFYDIWCRCGKKSDRPEKKSSKSDRQSQIFCLLKKAGFIID